jgi:hydrogenase maturation protease
MAKLKRERQLVFPQIGRRGRSNRSPGERSSLVIGYGNLFRHDDAVGWHIAKAIAEWRLPNVQALAVHQLTPELAEPIARATQVIFVDAVEKGEVQATTVTELKPAMSVATFAHTSDPRSLLALSQCLYGRCPPAWHVSVPGSDFQMGEGLSQNAREGIELALEHVAWLVGGASGRTKLD